MVYCCYPKERGELDSVQNRPQADEYRNALVCIDSYEDGVLDGRLYHPQLHSGEQFHSAIHFLRKMERLLDAAKFPQAFSTPRAFGGNAAGKGGAAAGTDRKTGKAATFTVRVIFRQNASWQGSVAWLEGGSEQRFRSVLELLLLMDSALESACRMEKSG